MALAITGATKRSSHEKLYQELGLEYLYRRRWVRRFCLLYKVFSTGQPSYMYDLLPPLISSCQHVNSFDLVTCKSEYFKNSFISNVIYEWNKLDPDIRSSASYNLWEKLKNIKRKENTIILKYTCEKYTYSLHINTKKIIAGFCQIFENL